jgi:hypothetical protein
MRHLIEDLEACIADGEMERASYYMDDLRDAVERIDAPAAICGAIGQSLAGLERALAHNDALRAANALRQIAWLAGAGPQELRASHEEAHDLRERSAAHR